MYVLWFKALADFKYFWLRNNFHVINYWYTTQPWYRNYKHMEGRKLGKEFIHLETKTAKWSNSNWKNWLLFNIRNTNKLLFRWKNVTRVQIGFRITLLLHLHQNLVKHQKQKLFGNSIALYWATQVLLQTLKKFFFHMLKFNMRQPPIIIIPRSTFIRVKK